MSGPSGCGKTTLALSLCEGLRQRTGALVMAFDQKGELAKRLGIKAAHTGKDLVERVSAGSDVAFNPHAKFPGNVAAGFCFFSAFAWHVSTIWKEETIFLVDEVQDFVGATRTEVPRPLASIVESGRGYKVHSIAIAQAANLVNSRLRQQFNRVAVFRQTDGTATAPLIAWGFDPGRVASLPRLSALVLNRENGEVQTARITWRAGRASVSLSAR